MKGKFLVRVLIVILAALLIYRIYDRVQSHRIPRDLCRSHLQELATAEIDYMYNNDGGIAPDLASLLEYAGLPDSVGVCPSIWVEEELRDSTYYYDPKLALGSQFAISCNNLERHGGVVGGLVEKEFPDSLFMEADWAPTFRRVAFATYAENRRIDASRANLVRVCEEQAAYLGNRYPWVLLPADLSALEISTAELVDPMGGEYVFETQPDTTYVFYQNPDRRGRPRGDSVVVETFRFVGYTTSSPEVSRVEVFFRRPLNFPSRADGALSSDVDRLLVIRRWDVSELGTQRVDEREVDLIDLPRWQFLQEYEAQNADSQ
ncbi:MAG: hypothetical protein QUS11_06040 [Candidatus Fermentibacter sp.]|nr:hypothetical protein [Candidatus Fermentibacter sp.]